MSWEGLALTYVSSSIKQLVVIPASFFTSDPRRWPEVIHPDDLPDLVSRLGSLLDRDTARLEHRFRLAGLRLIMLTSLSGRGDGKGCLEIGYDGYLVKPVSLDELVQAMDRWLPPRTPVRLR